MVDVNAASDDPFLIEKICKILGRPDETEDSMLVEWMGKYAANVFIQPDDYSIRFVNKRTRALCMLRKLIIEKADARQITKLFSFTITNFLINSSLLWRVGFHIANIMDTDNNGRDQEKFFNVISDLPLYDYHNMVLSYILNCMERKQFDKVIDFSLTKKSIRSSSISEDQKLSRQPEYKYVQKLIEFYQAMAFYCQWKEEIELQDMMQDSCVGSMKKKQHNRSSYIMDESHNNSWVNSSQNSLYDIPNNKDDQEAVADFDNLPLDHRKRLAHKVKEIYSNLQIFFDAQINCDIFINKYCEVLQFLGKSSKVYAVLNDYVAKCSLVSPNSYLYLARYLSTCGQHQESCEVLLTAITQGPYADDWSVVHTCLQQYILLHDNRKDYRVMNAKCISIMFNLLDRFHHGSSNVEAWKFITTLLTPADNVDRKLFKEEWHWRKVMWKRMYFCEERFAHKPDLVSAVKSFKHACKLIMQRHSTN